MLNRTLGLLFPAVFAVYLPTCRRLHQKIADGRCVCR
jgi:hypothetical protein